jgi:hypothetical protein
MHVSVIPIHWKVHHRNKLQCPEVPWKVRGTGGELEDTDALERSPASWNVGKLDTELNLTKSA